MRRRSPFRRLTALAAAYVVALQIVLLPLTVMASGSPRAAPLCSELAAGKSGPVKSTTGDIGCACASGCGTSCCTPGHSNPAAAAIGIDQEPAGELRPSTAFLVPSFGDWRGPQNPRAPPAV